jgi:hypothetical protein
MYKIICFTALLFFVTTSCNENKKADEGKKIVTDSKKQSTEDPYSTDTMYQALPDMLQDLSASTNMQELLAQNWILNDDKEALDMASDDGAFEMPVRSFSMAADFTIVKNIRNAMDNGTWKFDEAKKILTLKYTNGSSDIYKLRALAANEMKLTNVGIQSETVLTFVSDAKRYKNAADDPFYIANNKWRIKPRASETDAAIKQRLKDNLRFFILFYKDVIARKAAAASFYGLPSCLEWYAGRISIQNRKEISEKWKGCFYNTAEAMKAYDMMDNVISKKITWPKGTTNWLKKNLFALEQIYQNLQGF